MEKSLQICSECGAPLGDSERRTLSYNCGLPGINLENVEVQPCTACDNYESRIPRILELHRSIARAVSSRAERLNGKEIRFLRKYLSWTAVQMGRAFDVTPETVSRWENDHQPMGPTAERLLRVLAWQGPELLNSAPLSFSGEPTQQSITAVYTDAGWHAQGASNPGAS